MQSTGDSTLLHIRTPFGYFPTGDIYAIESFLQRVVSVPDDRVVAGQGSRGVAMATSCTIGLTKDVEFKTCVIRCSRTSGGNHECGRWAHTPKLCAGWQV